MYPIDEYYRLYVIIRHHSSSIFVISSTLLILGQSKHSIFWRRVRWDIPHATGKSQAKMDIAPTRRLKCKRDNNTSSLFVSSKIKGLKLLKVLKSRGHEFSCITGHNSIELLEVWIHTGTELYLLIAGNVIIYHFIWDNYGIWYTRYWLIWDILMKGAGCYMWE